MKCLDEGTLQSYSDNELPAAQTASASGHLEICEVCRARLDRIEAAACRVDALFDALDPEDLAAVHRASSPAVAHRRAAWLGWGAAGLAAALAAIAVFLLAGHRTAPAPVPVAKQEVAPPSPMPVAAPLPVVRRAKPKPVAARRPRQLLAVDDFIPLDGAGPMQAGIVVRVMLPVSNAQEIAADLVIGEDGRARAIRF